MRSIVEVNKNGSNLTCLSLENVYLLRISLCLGAVVVLFHHTSKAPQAFICNPSNHSLLSGMC